MMCARCLRTETGISGLAPSPDSSAYTLGFSPHTRHSLRRQKAEANPIPFLSRRMEVPSGKERWRMVSHVFKTEIGVCSDELRVFRQDRCGDSSRTGTAEGLDGDDVSNLVLDPEGSLWVGTNKALYRWNGKRFLEIARTESAVLDVAWLPG